MLREAEASGAQRELFDAYLWLTQLQQARCYEVAIGQWRCERSAAANTMGVLYWQLNASASREAEIQQLGTIIATRARACCSRCSLARR